MIKKVIECVALVCAVTGLGLEAVADYPANAYIRRGLVVQFDAIDNVGTGTHDSTAPVWKDLVSANAGAYDMTLTNKSTWSDTALVTNGKGAGASGPSPTDLTLKTMEGCYTLDNKPTVVNSVIYSSGLHEWIGGNDKMIWHIALLSYGRWILFGSGCDGAFFDLDEAQSGTHTMCWIKDDGSGFQDGIDLASGSSHNGWGGNANRNGYQTVGSLGIANEIACSVKMHAIRFYDRKLTADEIAFNSNVDQVRFKDADPAALAWPAEISYNSELERLEVEVTATYDERKGTLSVNGVAVPSGVATTVPYGNGTGVIAFVPSLKGYWLESVDIDEPEKVVAQDQVATVRLFDVRSFTAKIRGGGLILIVQ